MTALSYVPSPNVADLKESATIAVSARARALKAAGRAVIDLGAGEPDFPTPSHVCEAAKRAIDNGATRYTAVEGILPLRDAIASHANEHLRPGVSPVRASDVVVTSGSKQGLFNACYALFGAGDEVLVPTPGWTSYYEMVALARATPVAVRGSREHELKVTVSDLERASTHRTQGIMLNSPCNPTGAVYDAEELAAIAALAEERGWWIISDEIYRRIAYGHAAPSLLDVIDSRDRVIVVDGVAKAYAMTGWRIGWAIAPTDVARQMTALQSHTTSNASTVAQHAALAALTREAESDAAVTAMVSEFAHRRDAALAVLRRAGANVIEPRGAFYLFVRVGDSSDVEPDPGTSFARRLLEDHDIAVVPGAAFFAPEWIRLSYAAPEAHVLAGARAIADLLVS